MTNPALAEATNAVVKVGDGRGFIIEHDRRRLVITAAHCLPHFPPAHAASYLEERTYGNLLGTLDGSEQNVWAECLFTDPIADLAVLGEPDGQVLYDQYEPYLLLTETRPALRMADVSGEASAWVLQLNGRWTRCTVRHRGGPLWIENAEGETVSSGMSGSPIVDGDGAAIGAISIGGNGLNPRLLRHLPAWLAGRSTPS